MKRISIFLSLLVLGFSSSSLSTEGKRLLDRPFPITISSEDQLNLLREQAKTSDPPTDPNTYDKFSQLALAECIFPGQLEQSFVDCRRAIELYPLKKNLPNKVRRQYFPPLNPLRVAEELVFNDRTADGVALMKEALAKVEASNGSDSLEARHAWLSLWRFYDWQHDEARSLKAMERVLKFKITRRPATGGLGGEGQKKLFEEIYSWAQTSRDDKKFILQVLDKVLSAQIDQVSPPDVQIAETYRAIATVRLATSDEAGALDCYQHAYDIKRLFFKETVVVCQFMPNDYFRLLRESGRTQVAERLESLRSTHTSGWQPVEVDHSESLEQLKGRYEIAHAEAPYSRESVLLLRAFVARAASEGRWEIAAEYGLKLYDSDAIFGDTDRLSRDSRNVVTYFVKTQRLEEARVWLQSRWKSSGLNTKQTNALVASEELLLQAYINAGRTTDSAAQLRSLRGAKGISIPQLCSLESQLIDSLRKGNYSDEAKLEANEFMRELGSRVGDIDTPKDAILVAKIAIEAQKRSLVPAILQKGESLIPDSELRFFLRQFADLWRMIGDSRNSSRLLENLATAMRGDRPQSANQQCDKVATLKTSSGLPIASPNYNSNYSFGYAVFATDSLSFSDDARLSGSYAQSKSFAATYGILKTAQPTLRADKLSVKDDSPEKGLSALPQTPQLPLKPAVEGPEEFHRSFSGVFGERLKLSLSANDFVISGALDVDELQVERDGVLRLLLSKTIPVADQVFHLRAGGLANASSPNVAAGTGRFLEIWYAGTGTLKLDADSTFNGIIYAPNAKVEVGPGDANICGSIVAREVVVSGSAKLYWDPRLKNWRGGAAAE